MKSVLFVTNIPTPYRTIFFDMLSKSVQLTVAYERRSASNRDKGWTASDQSRSYNVIWLDAKSHGEESSISFSLIRHLKKKQYDIVIFGGYNSPTVIFSMIWMLKKHRPYGITCDGMLPKEHQAGIKQTMKNRLKRMLISHGDFFLSSGPITSKELVRWGADPERIFETVFSSVSAADIDAVPSNREICKRELGLEGKTVLLFVGQFIHRKGLDVLRKALDVLAEKETERCFTLVLAGGTKEGLDNFGLSFPEEMTVLTGFLNKTQLAAYYRAADLLVLPTREDIWGLVVNEAFAHALPVVTTDRCVAGMELIEPHRTGEIVPVEDPYAFANGILNALELKDRAAILDKAKRYTIENMTENTVTVLNGL